jgi:hypothetical protein
MAALACASLAWADAPPPEARALGITEAILTYCAKADPSAAARYQEQIKLLVQQASEQTLAEVRKSPEYLKAHASVDDFIAKIDPHNAKRVCSESLAKSQ